MFSQDNKPVCDKRWRAETLNIPQLSLTWRRLFRERIPRVSGWVVWISAREARLCELNVYEVPKGECRVLLPFPADLHGGRKKDRLPAQNFLKIKGKVEGNALLMAHWLRLRVRERWQGC